MNDNFDLKGYISSKRLLMENKEILSEEDSFKQRLNSSIRSILTEKKKAKKIDPADIDIESAFTKEEPQEMENIKDAPEIEDDIPTNANPVNLGGEYEQKPGYSKEEQEIQNSLKVAYDHAVAINDQKLATQIANTIKMFTSTHIVAGITN